MRNALVLGGVVFLVAGVSLAGGRSRGGETLRAGGGPAEAAAPQVREIAPGHAQALVNGQSLQARANNMHGYQETVDQYGSPMMYTAAVMFARVQSTRGLDGSMIYANNMIMAEAVVEATPEQKLESRKQSIQWMARDFGGASVTVFADNMTMAGLDGRTPAQQVRTIAGSSDKGTMVWADNNIQKP